jgi:Tol biopolymer transport system component
MTISMRVILSIALLATALAAAGPSTAQLAREVASKGWIVYSAKTEKGDWDLFLMRPDGSERRNITNTSGFNEIGGRFSPDGKKILYRRISPQVKVNHDTWGRSGQLVIADADGSRPVEYGEFLWASWSPDGKQVACLTTKNGIEFCDLATRKVLRSIDRKGIYQQLYWSPDGQSLTGTANAFGATRTVVRMNASTGEVNAVAKNQNCTPDWFPDSRHIIYSSRPPGQIDADGGSAAKAVGQKTGYGWTQLWMADIEGQEHTLLYGEDGRHIYGGAVSPDGRYILFTRSLTDGNEETAVIGLMRFRDAPTIAGESQALRTLHPKTKDGPVLSLGPGWEPHWTYARLGRDR